MVRAPAFDFAGVLGHHLQLAALDIEPIHVEKLGIASIHLDKHVRVAHVFEIIDYLCTHLFKGDEIPLFSRKNVDRKTWKFSSPLKSLA